MYQLHRDLSKLLEIYELERLRSDEIEIRKWYIPCLTMGNLISKRPRAMKQLNTVVEAVTTTDDI